MAGYPLDSESLWCEVFPAAHRGGPALFLDRDGVVVEETHYLSRVEDLALIPGAVAIIAAANARGIPVVLVTNQAGIARGYFGWAEFSIVQAELQARLMNGGAKFDAVYACAHHPEGKGPLAHPNHPARKPNPGMLLRAATDLSLDLTRSWLVGDHRTDIEAANNAGLAGALHVVTGHGGAERPTLVETAGDGFEIHFGQSIADARELPIFQTAPTRVRS